MRLSRLPFFCHSHDLFRQNTFIRYIAYLQRLRIASRSLAVHLAALAFCAKASGFSDTITDFHIWKMVEGYRRRVPTQLDWRRPVTPEVLLQVVSQFDTLCASQYEATAFKAKSLILFFGAFRPSEVLAASARVVQKELSGWRI